MIGRTLDGIVRSAKGFVKRTLRLVGLILAGVVVSILGVAFLAIGAVKWLSILTPSWLAWVIVGIILLLLGVAVTAVSMAGWKG